MASPPDPVGEGPPLDLARIMQTLDRHGVEYLLVGGVAAIGYGAQRGTQDVDCMLPRGDDENFRRLGEAMSELGARIRAGGLDDDVAKTLPANLDPRALGRAEISTWMTGAGALDVLTDLPDRTGTRLPYETLAERAQPQDIAGVRIRLAALEDIIASKEWANRPRTTRHSPSSTPSGTPKRLPSGPGPALPIPRTGSRHRHPTPGAPGYHLAVRVTSIADRLPSK